MLTALVTKAGLLAVSLTTCVQASQHIMLRVHAQDKIEYLKDD